MNDEPFYSTKLEEERRIRDIISVSLNQEERLFLESLKMYYHTKSDSTAIKNAAFEVYKKAKCLESKKYKKR